MGRQSLVAQIKDIVLYFKRKIYFNLKQISGRLAMINYFLRNTTEVTDL
jgi:hypothetical protein